MKTRTFNILTFFVITGVIALAILFMVTVPDVKDYDKTIVMLLVAWIKYVQTR